MDSFEEFIALPLSILKNRIIQITGYKSDFVSTKSIDIELSDEAIHINCVNSESAYNLLSSVIYKRQMNKKRLLQEQKEAQSQEEILLAN
ncbi:MAG: hypothetical protein IJ003_01490 [Candidatus Gastranaerophilales bacterium]|nr:hypothetical protein [Candidatus Gastranaerophilales bacterium]